ncbi:hypothetical protein DSO57_1032994 [Entomophthora muscae]|uniref:Uncharacterized protein n=1 Tax=Entomophthora muscae TaxID=34485 RepID=A0ACC2TBB9_9FUNG|nr:hypothetical protein DSO57_1032994 [Entomophthora muscae]
MNPILRLGFPVVYLCHAAEHNNILGHAQETLTTSESVVRSLACDNLGFSALKLIPKTPCPGPLCLSPPRTWWFWSKKKVWAPKSMPPSAPPGYLMK